MLNSMTGFGEGQGELNGVNYVVEIKALNSRYFKTHIKLPESVSFVEEGIERLLRTTLARGTVQYSLRLKEISASDLFEIDEAGLAGIVAKLAKITSSAGIEGTLDIGNLLSLPGIIKPMTPDKETAALVREKVLEITTQALDKLREMRAVEGKALEADLKVNCDAIEENLVVVKSRGGTVVKDYANRLKNRVDELLAEAKLKLDEETLAREVAVLSDRSDISEELARLDSHLHQFEQISADGGQAGRRLDFICQEMLREANTIASKATDAEIIRRMVDVKCRIDRLKEQVQNIE